MLKNNGFHNRHSPILRAFSPASLFSGGAPGAWYDPSDYSTLFQDSAGTTPVTAVEQPVGLMLDKSQGLVLGPELVTNGDFSSSANWATTGGWSIAGGAASLTSGGNLTQNALALLAQNKLVKITYSITSTFSGGGVAPFFQQTTPSAINVFGTYRTAVGTYTEYLQVPINATVFGFNSGSTSGSIDNISVKELPGNHAFQATSASRPVLSARYNLLTKTEQFDDAAWAKQNTTITANQVTAPDGTLTGDLMLETTANNIHWVEQTFTTTATGFKSSCCLKAGTRDWGYLRIRLVGMVDRVTYFNLATGVLGTVGVGITATITPAGNGWYLCTIETTAAIAGTNPIVVGVTTGDGVTVYAGDVTKGIYIWGASLVPANQSTLPYQRVNTATDYNTTGFLPYLRFDGVDDSLSTNSISFTATDKMSVFAGVRHMNTAATGAVFETSADAGANAGAMALYANTTSYSWRTGGSIRVTATASVTPPITNVATGLGDISGDLATLRLNGAQVAQSTADQGTGNFGNYPLFIGRRNNASLPFNGQMYSMIIVGKAVTAGELSSTETYVNQKTGAY